MVVPPETLIVLPAAWVMSPPVYDTVRLEAVVVPSTIEVLSARVTLPPVALTVPKLLLLPVSVITFVGDAPAVNVVVPPETLIALLALWVMLPPAVTERLAADVGPSTIPFVSLTTTSSPVVVRIEKLLPGLLSVMSFAPALIVALPGIDTVPARVCVTGPPAVRLKGMLLLVVATAPNWRELDSVTLMN